MDKGRTSGSEVSLNESELGLSSSSFSESDETDGARKVPLLRGDLKRDAQMRSQEKMREFKMKGVPFFPNWRWG